MIPPLEVLLSHPLRDLTNHRGGFRRYLLPMCAYTICLTARVALIWFGAKVGSKKIIHGNDQRDMGERDVFIMKTPGGGGFGPALSQSNVAAE